MIFAGQRGGPRIVPTPTGNTAIRGDQCSDQPIPRPTSRSPCEGRSFASTSCLLAGLLSAAPASADALFTIYLATHGDDDNSGLTLADAVATLDGAEQVLAAAAPDSDVEIRIAPGQYIAPTTYWQTLVQGHTISFLPLDYTYTGSLPPGGRPVFRSDGTPGYWLEAKCPPNTRWRPNLRLYYIEAPGTAGRLAIAAET